VELAANSGRFAAILRSQPICRPDGVPHAEGERLVEKTCRDPSRHRDRRSGGFYTGAIAERIAAAVAAEGGIVDAADLRGYRVKLRRPLVTRYRGLTVVGAPPPSSGGVVLEILNVLDGYNLRGEGAQTILGLHRIAQAEAAAFRDRARYYGDPDFMNVPMDKLLSAEHAEEIRREIAASDQRETRPLLSVAVPRTPTLDSHGTAVALTSTINTALGRWCWCQAPASSLTTKWPSRRRRACPTSTGSSVPPPMRSSLVSVRAPA
jgi:gamma-glutamyltranspeptidase/glutathione hydrolase